MPFPIRLLLCVSLCAKCHFVYFHAVVHSGYIHCQRLSTNIEIIQHFLLNNAALASTAALAATVAMVAAVIRQSIPSSILLEELETTSLYFFFSAEVSIRSTRKQFLCSAGVSEEPDAGGIRGS